MQWRSKLLEVGIGITREDTCIVCLTLIHLTMLECWGDMVFLSLLSIINSVLAVHRVLYWVHRVVILNFYVVRRVGLSVVNDVRLLLAGLEYFEFCLSYLIYLNNGLVQ
jgi:hypothetical protein